jgi:hypothetical protein
LKEERGSKRKKRGKRGKGGNEIREKDKKVGIEEGRGGVITVHVFKYDPQFAHVKISVLKFNNILVLATLKKEIKKKSRYSYLRKRHKAKKKSRRRTFNI